MKEKRYAEIPSIVKPIIDSGDGRSLRGLLGDALLKSGSKAEGVAVLEKYAEDGDATALNDAAYYLADNHAELTLARQYAEKAVSKREEETKKLALPWPKDSDLKLANSLASSWDTLGWVCYQMGDLAEAEKYLVASWNLSQRGIVADHLGQVYLKQRKRQAAIHTWQLALAADRSLDETRERLRNMGASVTPVRSVKVVSPDEELGRLRTAGVPSLPKQQGSAEFFVLLSSGGVEDSQFIRGGESLKSAGRALKQSELKAPLPDDNGEKVIRRGILSCSNYTTPSCQFVMLLPSTTQSASRPSN